MQRALTALLALGSLACATPSAPTLEERRARVETEIRSTGLAEHPAIEAARAELDAAIAQEAGEVAIDGLELRGALVHERDDKVQTLARLPLRSPLEMHQAVKARRAASEVALARLEEATLAQRVAVCLPSLEIQAHDEQQRIYARSAARRRDLLEWNHELRVSGSIGEVDARRFELESQIWLTTRDPSARPVPALPAGTPAVFDVLPEVVVGATDLRADSEVVQRVLRRHQPALARERAEREHFEALSRRETMARLPAPRFVDVGYEPVAFPGDRRQLEARVAIEVPFGREARANQRRFDALARAAKSRERAAIGTRQREAASALAEINAFRAGAERWHSLAALADASEQVAERWWNDRLADPADIANLLDRVHDARLAVLDARRRAGRAACAVIEATGATLAEWPQRAGGGSPGRAQDEGSERTRYRRATGKSS